MPHRRKILTIDELMVERERLRTEGRTVVQCHGCFDIVHPGHIRYLRFAANQGDILVVSVSGDAVVGKGHDRPYINEELRQENLAALEFVDYVVLDHHTWAGPVLEAVQPDVYVKGREYETNQDPRFLRERGLVEDRGGQVIFGSGDVVFSSTAIIRRYREKFDLDHEKVRFFCRRNGIDREGIDIALDTFIGKRLVVLADPILDCYVHCEDAAVAAESTILSVSPVERDWYLGGGALIAGQLAALGAEVDFVTAIGEDEHAQQFVDLMGNSGVTLHALPVQRRSTFVKTRYLVDGRKVFKVDEGRRAELSTADGHDLLTTLEGLLPDAEALVVTDFGYGLFGASLCDAIAAASARTGTPYYADVSGGRRASILKFSRPVLSTPTEDELRFAFGDRESGLSHLAARYFKQTGATGLVLTMGRRGAILFHPPEAEGERLPTEFLPALGALPVDSVGAGDCFLSGAVAADLGGASRELGVYLGTALASIHVGRLGNDPVPAVLLQQFLDTRPELIP